MLIVGEERMRIPPEEVVSYCLRFNRPVDKIVMPANYLEFRARLKIARRMIGLLKAQGKGVYLNLKDDQAAEEKISADHEDAVIILNATVFFYSSFPEKKPAVILLERITKAAAASLRKLEKQQSKK